jgi:uncharacterized membrane protein
MNIKLIILTGIILFFIDYIFISSYFGGEYKILIKDVQKSKMEVNIFSAIIAYAFLIGVIYYFIIKDKRSVIDAVILGSSTYGIYAWTIYALLKNWTFKIAIIDTIWGGVLFGLTTLALQYIEGVFLRNNS